MTALWERKPIGAYLANSAGISGASTLLSILLAAPAASALGRATERRRRRVLHGLLALTVFPPILLLYPLYQGVRVLGWLNHPLALVLPYAALSLPLSIWILERGFSQIPREVEEAAALDGLGPARRVLLIQLPLAAPSLVTAAILVFIFSWNEFMLALTFMTRDARKTITAGIASVSGSSIFEIPWGQLSAAIVIATLPLVAPRAALREADRERPDPRRDQRVRARARVGSSSRRGNHEGLPGRGARARRRDASRWTPGAS